MVMLPARPALELSPMAAAKLAPPAVVSAQGNTYVAPAGFQSDDLSKPGSPPASLGAFWPQPK
jgi:hypothetical protein